MKLNVNCSIDREIARRFNKHCEEKKLIKSRVIEALIKRYMDEVERIKGIKLK